MNGVKWISVSTDIFNDSKMCAIESMKDGMMFELIWIKILCLAGNCNENGYLLVTKGIPFSVEMMAKTFRMDVELIQQAVDIFLKMGMMEFVDGTYVISNWLKHQNNNGLSHIREVNRLRQQRYREKQKALANGEVTNQENNDSSDEPTHSNTFSNIADMWNMLEGIGIKPIRGISSKREEHLRARFREYGEESFSDIVQEIMNSDFLQGKHTGKPWSVTFDWVILPTNYPKVLEGNYRSNNNQQSGSAFDHIDIGE